VSDARAIEAVRQLGRVYRSPQSVAARSNNAMMSDEWLQNM
jgi:hypothetical protein